MQFHEKLARLTEDRIKTVLSKRAGLPAMAISNCLAKKQMPSAETAFRIARALGVSLAWLCDPHANWPPVRTADPDAAVEAAAGPAWAA